MTPAEILELEAEFGIRFPDFYKETLLQDLGTSQVFNDKATVRFLNRICSRKLSSRHFDWRESYWCIARRHSPAHAVIPGQIVIEYHFIDCAETDAIVYTIREDDPEWAIDDEGRIKRTLYSVYLTQLRETAEKAEREAEEEFARKSARVKKLRKISWWRRVFGPKPPKLPPPPEWMVLKVVERTGVDSAEATRLLSRANSFELHKVPISDPSERRRIEPTFNEYIEYLDSEKIDPIEYDDRFGAVLLRANLQADREVEREWGKWSMGACHLFWQRKKEILKKDYGVTWNSPAELNPNVEYD